LQVARDVERRGERDAQRVAGAAGAELDLITVKVGEVKVRQQGIGNGRGSELLRVTDALEGLVWSTKPRC
jgi:hypothetical protein